MADEWLEFKQFANLCQGTITLKSGLKHFEISINVIAVIN